MSHNSVLSNKILFIYVIPLFIVVLLLLYLWLPIYNHLKVDVDIPADYALIDAEMSLSSKKSINLLSTGIFHDGINNREQVLKISSNYSNNDSKPNIHKKFVGDFEYASFKLPRNLLRAYEYSNNKAYLVRLNYFLTTWYEYAVNIFNYDGYLRNDHTISERTLFMIYYLKFMMDNKSISGYADNHDLRKKLLHLININIQYLSKSSHYTSFSNHGTMQNIVLLAYDYYINSKATALSMLAIDRLNKQALHMFSKDGVVLENSTGYHFAGVEFFETAEFLSKKLKLNLSPDVLSRIRRAQVIVKYLLRKDGTIAAVGDTSHFQRRNKQRLLFLKNRNQSESNSIISNINNIEFSNSSALKASDSKLVCCAVNERSTFISKMGGIAIVNNSAISNVPASQMTLFWQNYPDHAHYTKHHPSVYLWADNEKWLTGLGYWPYVDPGRSSAVSWQGSNAPYSSLDSDKDDNLSWLSSHAISNTKLKFFEIKRERNQKPYLTRQIINIDNSIWIILDEFKSSSNKDINFTNWTMASTIKLNQLNKDKFEMNSIVSKSSVMVQFFGASKSSTEIYYGGDNKPIGWVVNSNKILAKTHTIQRRLPGNGMLGSAFILGANKDTDFVIANSFLAPSKWSIKLCRDKSCYSLKRNNSALTFVANGNQQEIALETIGKEQTLAERKEIHNYLSHSSSFSKKFKVALGFRIQVTEIIILTFILSMLLFIFLQYKSKKSNIASKLLTLSLIMQYPSWAIVIYILVDNYKL